MATLHINFFERILHPLYSSYHAQTYYGLALYVFLAAALCSLLATLAYLFSLSSVQDSEKRSEYECGFEPFDSATRLPFDVHFYLVGILFLIFDVEIALLFPWVLSLRTCGWFGFYLMLGFIVLLAVGFLYEWKRGALIWPSRQKEQPYFSGPTSNFVFLFMTSQGNTISQNFITQLQLTETSLYANLLTGILPEFIFTVLITAVLGYLAVQLGKDVDKFELAAKCLRYIRISIIVLLCSYIYCILVSQNQLIFNGYAFTSFSSYCIKSLTVIATLVITYNLIPYFKESTRPLIEFPIVLALSLLFLLFLLSASHLFTAFLAIVGFSLNTYVLIFFEANRSAIARESGIKYFYLSTFSSGLMVYGIFLIFLIFGTGHLQEIQKILACQPELLLNSLNLLHVGMSFLLFGLFFKLSAFPGHLWAVEVYDGAPDSIIAFFMVPVKVAVLTFVITALGTAFDAVGFIWQPLVVLSAIGSLIWGCFAALFELKTKRFLAYASINQIGFLLIGVAAGTIEGYRATLIYLFLYVAINIIFLIVFLNARRSDGLSLIYLTDFRRLASENWNASFSVAMALLSIAGIPPLAGFFGKYYLLLHAQEQGLYGLVAVALLTSLVSTYYYLRLIKMFWFENGVGVRAILCKLSLSQYYSMFIFEGLLWTVILYSAELVSFFDMLTLDLLGSNIKTWPYSFVSLIFLFLQTLW